MVRRIIIIFVVVFLFAVNLFAQIVQYTKRQNNEVRQGPGNYFPLSYVLQQGVPVQTVKKTENWIQIKLDPSLKLQELDKEIASSESWISKNCLLDKKPQKDWKDLDLQVQSIKASRSSVSAAIRGFALRYGKASPMVLDSLIAVKNTLFTSQEYLQFRDETRRLLSANRLSERTTRFGTYFVDYDIPIDESGIGLGIASRVAGNGLVSDPQLLKYINLLTTFLTEASGAYDYPFYCFVLKDEDVKAFSVPGGFIFITEGLVELCRDESELAGIIAHEMMHILLKHGLKEIASRPTHVKMDQAMEELDEEIGEPTDSTTEMLEDFALEAYENVMKPRIQSYEEEADFGGALLLAQVGYDAKAIPRMVLRIRDAVKNNEDIEMDNPFAYLDFQRRYDQITNFIKTSLPGIKGAKNPERFFANVKSNL